MKKIVKGSLFLFLLSILKYTYASLPLWSFSPITPTTLTITCKDTATIKYVITNHSKNSHNLAMNPIMGISQNTDEGDCTNPFTLQAGEYCTLSLHINGNSLEKNIHNGPVICNNKLQCYRPNRLNQLNITLEDCMASVASCAYDHKL
jgi:hypothetical protein